MVERISLASCCYERQFCYPGRMPGGPFVLRGSQVRWLGSAASLGDLAMWVEDGVPLAKRYLLAAYGANRNLANLAWKLKRAGVSGDVAGMPARLENADVVAANVFYSGHFYADVLLGREETEGVYPECVLLFVSHEQLCAINKSEELPAPEQLGALPTGPCALLAEFPVRIGEQNAQISTHALAYVSWSTAWSPQGDGKPVALAEVSAAHRKLQALQGGELFQLMCSTYFPQEAAAMMARRFSDLWRDVRSGSSTGYGTGWYHELTEAIRRDSADNGRRTGIDDAVESGRLLPLDAMWMPPPRYMLEGALNGARTTT